MIAPTSDARVFFTKYLIVINEVINVRMKDNTMTTLRDKIICFVTARMGVNSTRPGKNIWSE